MYFSRAPSLSPATRTALRQQTYIHIVVLHNSRTVQELSENLKSLLVCYIYVKRVVMLFCSIDY